MPFALRHLAAPAGALLLCAAVAGCSSPRSSGADPREDFDRSATFSRELPVDPARTCEAARRALLSQGYVVALATAEQVNGRKSFQPDSATHIQIELRVVCTPKVTGGRRTLAFVTALQDRYALKKSNTSASVGVGAIGSLSLPFSSSDDSLVKVASQTIVAPDFYERFFRLLDRYLEPGTVAPAPADAGLMPAETAPLPAPRAGAEPAVPAASPAASAAASAAVPASSPAPPSAAAPAASAASAP